MVLILHDYILIFTYIATAAKRHRFLNSVRPGENHCDQPFRTLYFFGIEVSLRLVTTEKVPKTVKAPQDLQKTVSDAPESHAGFAHVCRCLR